MSSAFALTKQIYFVWTAAKVNKMTRCQYLRLILSAGFGFVPFLDSIRRGALETADYTGSGSGGEIETRTEETAREIWRVV